MSLYYHNCKTDVKQFHFIDMTLISENIYEILCCLSRCNELKLCFYNKVIFYFSSSLPLLRENKQRHNDTCTQFCIAWFCRCKCFRFYSCISLKIENNILYTSKSCITGIEVAMGFLCLAKFILNFWYDRGCVFILTT